MVRPIVVSLRCLLPKGALFFLTVRETSERKAAAEKHRHEGGKKNSDVDRDTRLPSQDTRDNTRLRSTENLQPRPGHNKSSAYEDKKDRVDADALMANPLKRSFFHGKLVLSLLFLLFCLFLLPRFLQVTPFSFAWYKGFAS
ncbi:hypothetical protein LZ32DRAFT_60443 [Colletotrichum eremochloae]|nr:hypothetical protein LZ32DRAFT_60443 [Colletotrichum eremochloae]